MVENLFRRPLLNQLALAQKHHVIRHFPGKADLVGHYHQRDTQLREPFDDIQHLADQLGVEG